MASYSEIVLPPSIYMAVKSFNQYRKQTVTIQPQGSASTVGANAQIEFALPMGLVDISSFAVALQGLTLTGTTTSLPAWSDSVIQRCEIISNGNTIQVINNYNVLANVMRNLATTPDYALSFASVYGGGQNTRITASDSNYHQVISNWLGLLGCKKIIPVGAATGMSDLRVRLTLAPNNILCGTAGPTYSFNKVFATVNVISYSEPNLEQAIMQLNNNAPEIAFDYITQYSENYAGNSTLAVKIPVVASSLKAIVATSRISTYSTNAAVGVSGRNFETSNYFKFDGSTLSDLQIDTGNGLLPSQALSKSADMLAYSMESLGCDDNVLCGAVGCAPHMKDTLLTTALAQDLYEDYGYGVVFGFAHRDADNLMIGYNTKGNSTMLLRGSQAGGANTYQIDVFAVSSAVLTLGKGQWTLQV